MSKDFDSLAPLHQRICSGCLQGPRSRNIGIYRSGSASPEKVVDFHVVCFIFGRPEVISRFVQEIWFHCLSWFERLSVVNAFLSRHQSIPA
jgi:hypothetical protein